MIIRFNIYFSFKIHSILGLPALEAEDFSSFKKIVSDMTTIYGAGKICPYENQGCDLATEGLTLEPGIEAILGDTNNRSNCCGLSFL